MRYPFLLLMILLSVLAFSQEDKYLYQIDYIQMSDGEESKEKLQIINYNQVVYLSDVNDKIQSYIKLKDSVNIKTISVDNHLYKLEELHDSLPKYKFIDKDEKILKYQCKSVSYNYFSNTVEVWYTEETKAKGSPYAKFLPNDNALVLKIVVNGTTRLKASSIKRLKKFDKPSFLPKDAELVTKARFEELMINSRFTKISVFKDEQLYFDNDFKKDQDRIVGADKVYHFSKGSVILKKIKIPKELRNSSYVIADLSCKSNGDAYDRTGSVFYIPSNTKISVLDAYIYGLDTLCVYEDKRGNKYQGIRKTEDYDPPVELIRFFTSFGVGHFNSKKINNYLWEDEAVYKQDITKLFPNLDDEITIAIFVGNYDKGGHIVSLDLNFYPEWEEEKQIDKFIQPLFSTVNTMEIEGQNYGKLFKTDTLLVEFEITDTINELELLFTTTGHGGWGEGDEFVQRLNQILVDGNKVFSIIPWRTDCATYRYKNPASGNFGNGLSSSDLSRSNWCPGTLTSPYIIPLENLDIGKHTVSVIINQGDDEGNSFSAWSVTGVLVGKYKK